MLDEYASKYPCIRVIHTKNAGPGAARNTGLQNMTGTYVGFMDADDCYVPEVLEKVWSILSTNRAEAVCVGIEMIRQSEFPRKALETRSFSSEQKGEVLFDAPSTGQKGWILYRGDDIPVTYRMLLSADRVYMAKEIGYLYCEDESGESLTGVKFAPYYFDMVDRAKEEKEKTSDKI